MKSFVKILFYFILFVIFFFLGFKSAVVCVTLLNRLNEDQVRIVDWFIWIVFYLFCLTGLFYAIINVKLNSEDTILTVQFQTSLASQSDHTKYPG